MEKLFLFFLCCVTLTSARSQELPYTDISVGIKAIYKKVELRASSEGEDSYLTDYEALFIDSTYNSSMYTSIKFIAMDSIKRVERMKGNPLGPDISWYMVNGTKNSTVIFKDHINQEIIAHEKLAPNESTHFIYKDTDPMNWELIDEYQAIDDVKCYKAKMEFGGRTWIAWYNPEIPISEGPYKFHGLPGLIFQIEDITGSWRFDLMSLIEEKSSFLFNCSDRDHEEVSKLEFTKAKKYHYDNKLTIMKSQGYIFKDEKAYREILEKDKNWIELLL